MNDEVKEILDKVNKLINFDKNLIGWQINGNGEIISKEDFKVLLDYITSLQKENESLKEELEISKNLNICVGCENNPDYKSRCEKTMEYIKKNTHEYKMFNKELRHFSNLTNISIDKNNKVFIDNLLKILNGD